MRTARLQAWTRGAWRALLLPIAVLVLAGAAPRGSHATAAAGSSTTVGVVDAALVAPGDGYILVQRTQQTSSVTVSASYRLLHTRDGGRRWRDVTPPGVGDGWASSVTFATPRRGWLVRNDCSSGQGGVDVTVDGGEHWRASRLDATVCAAGSQLLVGFRDKRDGWAVQVQPTGPSDRLERTGDGGRRWSRGRRLDLTGPLVFESARDAYLAPFSVDCIWATRLQATHDAGRSWRSVVLPLPRGYATARRCVSLPTLFADGRGLVAAGLYRAKAIVGVALYTRAGPGRPWMLASVLPGRGAALSADPNPDAVTPTTWWSALGRTLAVTGDAGRHWTTHPLPQRDASKQSPAGSTLIRALDAAHAWLVQDGALLATADGGAHWVRLVPPA